MNPKRGLLKVSLPEVLRDPEAGIAWRNLTRKGASPGKLEELLQLAMFGHGMGRPYDMLFVDGLKRNQVTNFPTLLRRTAASIDSIRENPHLDSVGATDPGIVNLPSALRAYANELEGTIQFARKFMERNPRYWDFPSIFKLKLLNYVEKTTGSPRYSAVARLLNGAFTTLGMTTIVEPSSLRKLAERQLKTKATSGV
jgi:hypothetical protein